MKSIINVNFSAASEKGATSLVELFSTNISNDSVWHTIQENTIKYGNGSMGSYWNVDLAIVVPSDTLNTCLVQLDAIKAGFIANSDEVMSELFPDVRIELESDDAPDKHLNETVNYLLNKLQEKSRSIEAIENRLDIAITKLNQRERQVDQLQQQYYGLASFVHERINLDNLNKFIRAIANDIDPDILNTYKVHNKH